MASRQGKVPIKKEPWQVQILDSCFADNPRPSADEYDEIADRTQLPKATVKAWYKDKRRGRRSTGSRRRNCSSTSYYEFGQRCSTPDSPSPSAEYAPAAADADAQAAECLLAISSGSPVVKYDTQLSSSLLQLLQQDGLLGPLRGPVEISSLQQLEELYGPQGARPLDLTSLGIRIKGQLYRNMHVLAADVARLIASIHASLSNCQQAHPIQQRLLDHVQDVDEGLYKEVVRLQPPTHTPGATLQPAPAVGIPPASTAGEDAVAGAADGAQQHIDEAAVDPAVPAEAAAAAEHLAATVTPPVGSTPAADQLLPDVAGLEHSSAAIPAPPNGHGTPEVCRADAKLAQLLMQEEQLPRRQLRSRTRTKQLLAQQALRAHVQQQQHSAYQEGDEQLPTPGLWSVAPFCDAEWAAANQLMAGMYDTLKQGAANCTRCSSVCMPDAFVPVAIPTNDPPSSTAAAAAPVGQPPTSAGPAAQDIHPASCLPDGEGGVQQQQLPAATAGQLVAAPADRTVEQQQPQQLAQQPLLRAPCFRLLACHLDAISLRLAVHVPGELNSGARSSCEQELAACPLLAHQQPFACLGHFVGTVRLQLQSLQAAAAPGSCFQRHAEWLLQAFNASLLEASTVTSSAPCPSAAAAPAVDNTTAGGSPEPAAAAAAAAQHVSAVAAAGDDELQVLFPAVGPSSRQSGAAAYTATNHHSLHGHVNRQAAYSEPVPSTAAAACAQLPPCDITMTATDLQPVLLDSCMETETDACQAEQACPATLHTRGGAGHTSCHSMHLAPSDNPSAKRRRVDEQPLPAGPADTSSASATAAANAAARNACCARGATAELLSAADLFLPVAPGSSPGGAGEQAAAGGAGGGCSSCGAGHGSAPLPAVAAAATAGVAGTSDIAGQDQMLGDRSDGCAREQKSDQPPANALCSRDQLTAVLLPSTASGQHSLLQQQQQLQLLQPCAVTLSASSQPNN